MSDFRNAVRAVVGLSVALLSGSAFADAPAPLVGEYYTYTFLGDPGLFGSVSLSGDDLVFAPTAAFKATSVGGAGAGTFQNLTITVSVNEAYQSSLSLSGFSLTEGGSYSLTEGGTAVATGFIEALDIEGTTDNSLKGTIAATGLGVVGGTQSWTGTAGVTLPGTGWGGADGVVSSVNLTISNQLFATSVPGSSTEIWKDAVSLHVVTTPVPEAETYAMLLVGLGLVGFMVRRRNRVTG